MKVIEEKEWFLSEIAEKMSRSFEKNLAEFDLEVKQWKTVFFEEFQDGDDITPDGLERLRKEYVKRYGIPKTHTVKDFLNEKVK